MSHCPDWAEPTVGWLSLSRADLRHHRAQHYDIEDPSQPVLGICSPARFPRHPSRRTHCRTSRLDDRAPRGHRRVHRARRVRTPQWRDWSNIHRTGYRRRARYRLTASARCSPSRITGCRQCHRHHENVATAAVIKPIKVRRLGTDGAMGRERDAATHSTAKLSIPWRICSWLTVDSAGQPGADSGVVHRAWRSRGQLERCQRFLPAGLPHMPRSTRGPEGWRQAYVARVSVPASALLCIWNRADRRGSAATAGTTRLMGVSYAATDVVEIPIASSRVTPPPPSAC